MAAATYLVSTSRHLFEYLVDYDQGRLRPLPHLLHLLKHSVHRRTPHVVIDILPHFKLHYHVVDLNQLLHNPVKLKNYLQLSYC